MAAWENSLAGVSFFSGLMFTKKGARLGRLSFIGGEMAEGLSGAGASRNRQGLTLVHSLSVVNALCR